MPYPEKFRLVDVARAAGVSVATASVALNRSATKTIRVTEDTADRIRHVARSMGYAPNTSARLLAGKSVKIMGVIMDSHAVPSAYEVLQAITEEAAGAGYQVMVSEVHDSVQGVALSCNELLRYGADGVICLAHDYPDQRALSLETFAHASRTVFLNPVPGTPLTGPAIAIRDALDDALAHLQANGRTAIGCILPDTPVWDIEHRRIVLRELCAQRRLPEPRFRPVEFVDDRERIAGQMAECVRDFILPAGIDAVFAVNDLYAAHLGCALRRNRLEVPGDVALVGWDNCSFCEALTPPLASVDSDTRAQGKAAVRLLLKLLLRQELHPPETVVRSRFIRRESAGGAAAREFSTDQKGTCMERVHS